MNQKNEKKSLSRKVAEVTIKTVVNYIYLRGMIVVIDGVVDYIDKTQKEKAKQAQK